MKKFGKNYMPIYYKCNIIFVKIEGIILSNTIV